MLGAARSAAIRRHSHTGCRFGNIILDVSCFDLPEVSYPPAASSPHIIVIVLGLNDGISRRIFMNAIVCRTTPRGRGSDSGRGLSCTVQYGRGLTGQVDCSDRAEDSWHYWQVLDVIVFGRTNWESSLAAVESFGCELSSDQPSLRFFLVFFFWFSSPVFPVFTGPGKRRYTWTEISRKGHVNTYQEMGVGPPS